jgi:murein DD-endopeptidase MepM/ murein hydrolase activator NlpD
MSLQSSRARVASRLAVATLISAGIAGCSADVSRFNDNPFQTSSIERRGPPAREVTGSVPHAAPVARVESQPLPASQPSLPPPPPYRAPPPVASYHPSAPVYHPPAPRASAEIHVVAPHETLSSIARHYGKSRAEIARANGISPNTMVRLGQRLKIPGAQEHLRAAAATPERHEPRHEMHARTLAPPERPLAVPTKAAAVTRPAPKVAARATAPTPAVETHKTEKALVAAPAEEAVAEAKAGQPATTGAIPSFRWPVRGRIIAGFGPKPNGQENDGINLAVPEGTSVKAADDGVVAYAGNELKGYGNLVLLRHRNGYVTAYAHASKLKVHRGETVKRGQIIALAGETGSVSSPQLHFEIRKGSTPVDPSQYLHN